MKKIKLFENFQKVELKSVREILSYLRELGFKQSRVGINSTVRYNSELVYINSHGYIRICGMSKDLILKIREKLSNFDQSEIYAVIPDADVEHFGINVSTVKNINKDFPSNVRFDFVIYKPETHLQGRRIAR